MPKKILAITSHYPPYHLGGYELRCKDILDELARRGHKILVLTSVKEGKPKLSNQIVQYEILRKLHRRKRARHFVEEVFFDVQDTLFLERQIKSFQPDLIYLGHIMPLSKALMPYLASCKVPILYDEGGMGLIASWENRGRWFYFVEEYVSQLLILNKIKPLVINIICKVSGNRIKPQWAWPGDMQIIFNSELNRINTIAKGIPVQTSMVIHSGLDTEKFVFLPKSNLASLPLFIVPGRIELPKGQKNAVELLAKLQECGIDGKVIFIGEKYSHFYYSEIEREINEFQLADRIKFLPMLPQEQLIDFYHQADVCFFPSFHKTGFSRVPLEAMACGCIVISYGGEGSNEVVNHGKNGFLIRPWDSAEMVTIMKKLKANPKMVAEITSNARRDIEQNYSMQKYVDKIENTLIAMI